MENEPLYPNGELPLVPWADGERVTPAGRLVYLHVESEDDSFTFDAWHCRTLVECNFVRLREEFETDEDKLAKEFVDWLLASSRIELVEVEDVPLRPETMSY